jgi:hypothetical protein
MVRVLGVSDILWGPWQRRHIAARHRVSAEEFEQAWTSRVDVATRFHAAHGTYYQSYGLTDDDRELELIWRWNDDTVWPITAFDHEETDNADSTRKKRRKIRRATRG